MALQKPAKDYYSLTEIAEEWEWSVRDVFDYARQGKLELCVRLVNRKAFWLTLYSGEKHHSLRDLMEGIFIRDDSLHATRKIYPDIKRSYEYVNGIYPVLLQQLDVEEVHTDDQGELFLETVFVCVDVGVKGTKYWSAGWHFSIGGKLQLNVTHKEKTRFEKEHEKPTESVVQNISCPSSREEEKPLRTLKAIAKYCDVHEATVKTWRKQDKNFPASPPGSGTVTALPSELNAWLISKGKK